jgi:hypothetical protein
LTKVIDKMAAAARALGWPEEIVDATRAQMQISMANDVDLNTLRVGSQSDEQPKPS